LGACSDLHLPFGCNHADMDAAIAVITGDIRMGSTIEQALSGIRLLMLSNAACWRLPCAEPTDVKQHGVDTVQARLAPAFSPVACTIDELGDAWKAGRLHLTLQTMLNGRKLGLCDVASAMPANFGELLARLAKARNIRCGAILSAGLATNPERHTEHTQGHTSIAHKRAAQVIESGTATTDYLQDGDKLVIDMKGKDGASIFGAIHQTVFMPTGISA
jgi:fumarylacetoacetate (FAA) hydrolase